MDGVDGHYLEKGDYGYRRYETLREVIDREKKEQADKHKGPTFEDLDYEHFEYLEKKWLVNLLVREK